MKKYRSVFSSYVLCVLLIFLSTDVCAKTRYVNHNATGSNNGSDWANAYESPQSAINVASSGDELWVAEGTYKPSAYPAVASGSTDRDWSFYLEGGVHLYGGFDVTETTLAARDYATNATILNGDLGNINESTAGTLDGFTVTRGNASVSGTLTVNKKTLNKDFCGGMCNYGSPPTFANSILWGNKKGTSTATSGSDIQNSGSTPTITYTTLQQTYSGSNNRTLDPLFADASNPAGAHGIQRSADDGLRLFSNSPAANSGNNSSIPSGISTDIIGSARIQNTTVNRGAYEDLTTGCGSNSALPTTAELTWAAAREIDNSHFMIERSYDGEHFEEVARVRGNGNSSEVLHYAYTDMSIAKGTQVAYYGLHQFDYNGVSEYSEAGRVTFGMNNLDEQNIAVYPNPFTSDVYINCSTLSGRQATITVTNINVQQLLQKSVNNTEQIEKVDLSSLSKGMYFVNVTSDIGTTIVKVIKI